MHLVPAAAALYHRGTDDFRRNGRLSFVDKDLAKAAFKLTKKLVKGDSSFITVIYGSDVTDDAAEALYKQISNKYSNLDVNLINGGQPVYYYIISVE